MLLNLEGYALSPISKWDDGNVVFCSLGQMKEAITGYRQGKPQYARLGDWSPFIDRLDPFRDGHAADRIGEFVANVLAGMEQGRLDTAAALEQAVEQYTATWGADKVQIRNGTAKVKD